MKRTIDDRDGNPVEIEIEDTRPQETPLDEIIQALLLAREIQRGALKPPPIMPGHENRYPRKKKKGE